MITVAVRTKFTTQSLRLCSTCFSDQTANDFHPKCTIRPAGIGNQTKPEMCKKAEVEKKSVELKHIHTGDTKVRAKVRFEVVTARVLETGGKKHVVSCFKPV